MLKKLKLNVLPVMIFSTFFLLSRCEFVKDNQQIESIDVYSIDWDIFSNYRYDTENVLKSNNHKMRVIKSLDTVNNIIGRMEKLKPLPEFTGVDTRMVLFIKYSNGATDTVKVGSPKLIEYKGRVYDNDPILIELLK